MIGVFLGSLFGSLTLGVPIAFALLASAVMLMFAMGTFDSQIVAQNLINGANNFSLMAIPFFVLAGELMNAGGISKRIVDFSMALVGHIRGGLGFVAIIASILFAGLSGSAVADTAALGAILIPMMIAKGYNVNTSTGIICASGIIAPVIPPSIPMILFGVTAGVSITDLFMGGIIPGIMMGVGLMIGWFFMSRKDTSELPPRKSAKEIWKAIQDASFALMLPVIIIGGLRGGVFTPTEAAVVAAFYALFVGLFIYRELKLEELYQVLIASAKTTSVVMFVAAAAMVSAWLITVANVPAEIAGYMGSLVESPLILMMVIMIFLLLIGLVMDLTPAILIFTPVLLPLVKMAGIDPVYFGIVMVINLCIGLITPPVGTVLYVGCGISKISLVELTKGIWPFLVVHVIVLLLLILFPEIITVPLAWLN
ncbi:TRAP transporter large permease subunit [Cytobacillus firmus]|jgi:TRAP-type transport system large permease protein|uniref:TRAP transporter large permease subunit n=1 Tax=Cytobacillus firmus TaxID=1399 RepID=A0AA46P075_CYTFI|nr:MULTISPECIES: TRAP transporter large permease subunit [Bacillaceae]KML41280.1 L-dehydroascorbate transporter large permease subunit [Cytobacillus firmus]MBG9444611.1 L-dehydroascorbate transporter large permease subunit [Cytobacillus firmus]MBG9452222.1 L-dehydroascorbate transporter large permease subunit [Cytobacillus firmus]MCC3648594.1 TRAP transporter large permease subunit [Cytobacillus oceanisediminis]MCS0654706.1 TRAP transporter large permease subunit [Cytobacillus firmus]